jgi:hypothetical protein
VNGSPTVGTAPAARHDYGPYQLADYLGAYGGQVLRARTFGLLPPANRRGGRAWSAALAVVGDDRQAVMAVWFQLAHGLGEGFAGEQRLQVALAGDRSRQSRMAGGRRAGQAGWPVRRGERRREGTRSMSVPWRGSLVV